MALAAAATFGFTCSSVVAPSTDDCLCNFPTATLSSWATHPELRAFTTRKLNTYKISDPRNPKLPNGALGKPEAKSSQDAGMGSRILKSFSAPSAKWPWHLARIRATRIQVQRTCFTTRRFYSSSARRLDGWTSKPHQRLQDEAGFPTVDNKCPHPPN